MSGLDIEAIRERRDWVNPGMWQSLGEDVWARQTVGELVLTEHIATCDNDEDASFIAHAAQDVTALCDEVEHLRTERHRGSPAKRIRKRMARWMPHSSTYERKRVGPQELGPEIVRAFQSLEVLQVSVRPPDADGVYELTIVHNF